MYDFLMAAFPWIAMGLGVAIACANAGKIELFWDKWNKSWNKGGK